MDADAIVIGAGAAGLSAAGALGADGLRVVVLEARERVGGRILSRPTDRRAIAIELGPEFVHGAAPETTAVLRAIGGTAVESGGRSWTRGADGMLHPENDTELDRAMELVRSAHAHPGDVSVDAYLCERARDPALAGAIAAARAFVEGFDAADPTLASLHGIAHEWRSAVDEFSTRPIGGYAPIVAELRRRCDAADVRVRLATVVTQVAYGTGGVAVRAADGSIVRARGAVVTVPIGVLHRAPDDRGIRFDPPLPAATARALAGIAMGDVAKVVLRFHAPFWELLEDGRYRDAAFFRDPNGPFQAYWTQMPLHGESVVAWLGGPRAACALARGRDALIAEALHGFGALLGAPEAARRAFADGTLHDWSADPYARGAYSYLRVGAGRARTALTEPVAGTLWFAGEATVDDGSSGTVDGAIASGLRAAAQVRAALGAQSGRKA